MKAPVPVAIVAMMIVTGTGCAGPSPLRPGPAQSPAPRSSEPEVDPVGKVADAVARTVDRVETAQRAGSGDLARMSDGLVHVRGDGAVEVVLHATIPVGGPELADLRAIGVDVVDVSSTPPVPGQPRAGLVQAWVAASGIGAVIRLPWVAAVTPPAYPPTGG